VTTLIGYGSPNKADSYTVHGSPLGPDETKLTREFLKWPYPEFEVPKEVYAHMDKSAEGAAVESAWNATMAQYTAKYPKEAAEFSGLLSGKLPEGWANALPTFTPEDASIATRQHSQTMLNALAPVLPGARPAAAAAAAGVPVPPPAVQRCCRECSALGGRSARAARAAPLLQMPVADRRPAPPPPLPQAWWAAPPTSPPPT
jgi:hypothetical protein